jgi:hypothetical protein
VTKPDNSNHVKISDTTLRSISIDSFSLRQGLDYTFQIKVTSPTGGIATSSITFSVNTAPTGGTFEIKPTVGYELDTKFTLAAVGWTDDIEDFPLQYQFFNTNA